MVANRFAFPETEKCFRNAIFTHSVRNARNVQYSLLSSEASVCERCSQVNVHPPFCFPRNREMLQTRDDDQLSEIFTHNARDARNVQYSLVSSEASVCERSRRVHVSPPLCFPRNREMLQNRDDDQLSDTKAQPRICTRFVPQPPRIFPPPPVVPSNWRT
jgi:hypothetical protein